VRRDASARESGLRELSRRAGSRYARVCGPRRRLRRPGRGGEAPPRRLAPAGGRPGGAGAIVAVAELQDVMALARVHDNLDRNAAGTYDEHEERNYSVANSMHGSGFLQCLPAPNLRCELPAGIMSDIPLSFRPTSKGALSIWSILT